MNLIFCREYYHVSEVLKPVFLLQSMVSCQSECWLDVQSGFTSGLTMRFILDLAASLLLLGTLTNAENIVIVGGSVAGLAAASKLILEGHDVTILEGSERVGGRMKV